MKELDKMTVQVGKMYRRNYGVYCDVKVAAVDDLYVFTIGHYGVGRLTRERFVDKHTLIDVEKEKEDALRTHRDFRDGLIRRHERVLDKLR